MESPIKNLGLGTILFISATTLIGYSVVRPGDAAKVQQEERVLESLIPKHVPLGIKIRKEKEFKDLSNENWARDFELEVTNTGNKPIYSFYMLLKLDVTSAAGDQIVAPLYY